jgi:predicted ATP-grasp superfamily ATP-dependent carboligase
MALHRRELDIPLQRPVLVMGLDGWVDAGLSGSNAVSALLGSMRTETLITFDADQLVDHRSRRPVQRIVNGVLESVTYTEIQIRHGADAAGNDVLLLVGPEPDYRWRAFTTELTELCAELGVRLAVGLGGFPAPMPHTRPTRIIATAIDQVLANDVGFIPGVREVPAGIHAALLKGFESQGIPALSLWAMVPHYVSGMPYPDASVGLLDHLARLGGVTIDVTELRAAAAVTKTRIDGLIAQNPEHVAMVEQLERQLEAEAADGSAGDHPPLDMENLPSGDEIAAELQRFLREEGQG